MSDKTHFGYQQVPEEEKARRVGAVFSSVAPSYDVMNDLMSLGLHRAWKAIAIAVARPRSGERVLDIATGSGDLALALARKVAPGGEVWITDINRRMLERGRDRLLDRGLALPAVQCDAEKLPFPSAHFDCVTVGFGLRNMTHKDAALAEMARVLKPGGRLVLMDSLQRGDEADYDAMLESFPQRYHEPYFESYTGEDFPSIASDVGLTHRGDTKAFVSKVMVFDRAA